MKRLVSIVKEMTPAAAKRTVWRDGLAYRYRRYAGAVRLVPCVDENGLQWSKWNPMERTIRMMRKMSRRKHKFLEGSKKSTEALKAKRNSAE